MSVLAAPRKGNQVNQGGIEPMMDKPDGSTSLGKIEPFLLADEARPRTDPGRFGGQGGHNGRLDYGDRRPY